MSLCQYKDIFGAPGTGAHAYRFMDIAVVDLGLTIGAAYLISEKYKKSFPVTFLGLFVVGMVAHRAFCVETGFLKMLRK